MEAIVQDLVLETSAEISLQPNSQQDLPARKFAALIYLQHLDCGLRRQTPAEIRQNGGMG